MWGVIRWTVTILYCVIPLDCCSPKAQYAVWLPALMSQEERSFPLFKTLFGPCPGEVKIWGHLLVFFCSWNCFASRVGIGIPMVMQVGGGGGGGRARSIVLCSSVLGKSPFICTFTRVQSLRYDKGRRTMLALLLLVADSIGTWGVAPYCRFHVDSYPTCLGLL